MRSPRPRTLVPLLLGAWLLAPAAAASQDPPGPAPRRVVIFGIDGADAERFESLRTAGRLPNFDALAKRGTYGRLATSNPAQSPVSWTNFSTATNPGKHGIYDFLRRDPAAPERIELSLAGKTWSADGLPGRAARTAAPWVAGVVAGLLVFGLLALLLRLARPLSPRARRGAALLAGLLAAGAAGAAIHRVVRWIPESLPTAVSHRRGVPLWTVLGEAGVPTVALEAPVSFPADRARNLRLLAGLGTPDVQGHWGLYSVFTTDGKEEVTPETGGFVDALAFGEDGVARSRVYGPPRITLTLEEEKQIAERREFARQLWAMTPGVASAKRPLERVWQHAERADQTSCILEVRRDPAAGTATIRVGAGGPRPVLDLPMPEAAHGPVVALPDPADPTVEWGEPVTLKEKEWSDRVAFRFVQNPLLEVAGLGRFWLESAGGGGKPFRLLLTPVEFDPRAVPPNVGLSWPREFAPSLAAEIGLYSTLGWPCLTNPVKDRMLSDEAFLAHARLLTEERRKKTLAALRKDDWRFLFTMFSEVDRVQHAFWRHLDPKHPLHDPEAAKRYGGAVDQFYEAMDSVLGDILGAVGEDTAVIVMSDHGFASFRRGVNLNTFLLRNGFQANKGGSGDTGPGRDVNELFSGASFFERIDWDATKAYALGLGSIYLNLKGREKRGCVDPADYDAVCAAIREGLLALRDADGSRVVREVYRGRDIYAGPTTAKYAPDLVLGFERGYRVSWQTTLGGGGAKVIEDNDQPWSGDHCSVDPSLVPGILVTSVPLRTEGARVMDVAPTVLDLFGVPAPEEWDGRSLVR